MEDLEIELLSDHRSIRFYVLVDGSLAPDFHRYTYRRWNWRNVDREMFAASLEWRCGDFSNLTGVTPDFWQQCIYKALVEASDLSAPRSGTFNKRNQAY